MLAETSTELEKILGILAYFSTKIFGEFKYFL